MKTEMEAAIARAVEAHLPGRTVVSVKDRGLWCRHIAEVELDGGERLVVKMHVRDDWLDSTVQEGHVARIFAEHGIPSARVLAVDTSGELLPHPFIVQEAAGGKRMGDLLREVDEEDALAIYQEVGRIYRRIHAIPGPRDGLWGEDPHEPWGAPTDYMFRAEVVAGSGKQAVEAGLVSPETHARAVALWERNLDDLKAHPPSLVHGSPFLWTIYLERSAKGWRIAKLTGLGDVLWWDPAYDLAFLRYPPFGEVSEARWAAFLRGYGAAPERKRLLLYAVMQRLCAAMGVYLAPEGYRERGEIERALDNLPRFLDEIESYRPAA